MTALLANTDQFYWNSLIGLLVGDYPNTAAAERRAPPISPLARALVASTTSFTPVMSPNASVLLWVAYAYFGMIWPAISA